jgi:hypothetical protein
MIPTAVTVEITVSWDMKNALLFQNNLLPAFYILKMEAADSCRMLLPIHQLHNIRCQKVALFIITTTRTSYLT